MKFNRNILLVLSLLFFIFSMMLPLVAFASHSPENPYRVNKTTKMDLSKILSEGDVVKIDYYQSYGYGSGDIKLNGVWIDNPTNEAKRWTASVTVTSTHVANFPSSINIAMNSNDTTDYADIYHVWINDVQVFPETDTTAPSTPTGVTTAAGDTVVDLSWTANTEPDLAGYNVYVDGVKKNSSLITGTNYTVTGLTNGTTYGFTVSAVDTSGNESTQSTSVSSTPQPPDTVPPAAPTELTAAAGDTVVDLSWTANTEPDLAGYNVYVDGVKKNSSLITGTNYTITGLTNGTTYGFTVSAVDTSGNESTQSTSVSSTPQPPDTIAPATPSNFTVGAGDGSATLSWDATTESDLRGYNIYQSTDNVTFTKVNSTPITGTSYQVEGLTNDQTYYFAVSALDTSGNESDLTLSVSSTPKAGVVPKNASWGFTPADIFVNSMVLVASLAGFVLLGLAIAYLPKLIAIIRAAAS